MVFNAPNAKLHHFFRGHGDLSKDQGSNAILATVYGVVSLFTLAQIFDETLPIINKSKHLKRGEYKVLSFYSMSKKTKEPPSQLNHKGK